MLEVSSYGYRHENMLSVTSMDKKFYFMLYN